MDTLDVCSGERYLFPEEDKTLLYEVVGNRRDGAFLLKNETSGKRRTIGFADFSQMRCDGRAVRVRTLTSSGDIPGDVDPTAFLPPDDPALPPRERAARRRAADRLAEARTLRFYVIKHDRMPEVGRTDAGLERFIRDHEEEAASVGHLWRPSASAVRRALDRYGEPGDRSLVYFLERRRVHSPFRHWHEATLLLKQKMVDLYWSDRKVRIKDATKFFKHEFGKEAARRKALGEADLARPSKETLRLWINNAGSWENWRRRFGEREANRRFRGRGPGIEASRFLETVLIDHTWIDLWSKVVDDDGKTVTSERGWLTLALDLHTRIILAAILSYEPPSILTLMECLKQAVRPKKWLIAEFGDHMGASAWGKMATLVLDNEWAHVGVSFQVFCEAAGIDLIFAPLKTPEFKGQVERIFRTINEEVFHRLPGGIPHKPTEMTALGLEPRTEDLLTIEEIADRFWRWACTDYHMRVHRGIDMAPARALKLSLERHGRPTVDDIRSLDKLMGQTVRCRLSPVGVHLRGHRFHHPETVTRLLDELLRTAPKGRRKPRPMSSGGVWVVVTLDPSNCGYVHVWNYARRRNEKLWNVNPKFADGCSWKMAEAIAEQARRENAAFETDEEKARARSDYEAALEPAIKERPFREGRKLIRHYVRRKTGLVAGNTVVEATAEPSASGMEGLDIPQGLAATERTDDRIPPKGPRRGGKAAVRKAAATRARNAARRRETEGRAAIRLRTGSAEPGERQVPVSNHMPRSEFLVADASDMLAQLSADLDKEV
jgi:putative transposase